MSAHLTRLVTLGSLTLDEIAPSIPGLTEIHFIHAGGQKAVFKCTVNAVDYALKIVPLTNSQDGYGLSTAFNEYERRIQREIDLLRRINCRHLVKLGPNIPSLATVRQTQCIIYLEEWLDGNSLEHNVASYGPYSTLQIKQVASAVIRAVGALHENNLIHRDIKPGNIMSVTGDEYRLIDLGLVLDLDDVSLTGAGICGTIRYCSPEQLDPQKKRLLDFRSDLYSLGATLFYAATGVKPYSGSGASDLPNAIMFERLEPVIDINPAISPSCSEFIARLAQKQPHSRFRSIDLALTALEEIAI